MQLRAGLLWQVDEDGHERWQSFPTIYLQTHSAASVGHLFDKIYSELAIANGPSMNFTIKLVDEKHFRTYDSAAALEEFGFEGSNPRFAVEIFPFGGQPTSLSAADASLHTTLPYQSDFYNMLLDVIGQASLFMPGDLAETYKAITKQAWWVLQTLPSAQADDVSIDGALDCLHSTQTSLHRQVNSSSLHECAQIDACAIRLRNMIHSNPLDCQWLLNVACCDVH